MNSISITPPANCPDMRSFWRKQILDLRANKTITIQAIVIAACMTPPKRSFWEKVFKKPELFSPKEISFTTLDPNRVFVNGFDIMLLYIDSTEMNTFSSLSFTERSPHFSKTEYPLPEANMVTFPISIITEIQIKKPCPIT